MVRKPAFTLDAFSTRIPPIFDQVQASAANHRKNCVALHKLHTQAASITENVRNAKGRISLNLAGERAFTDIFLDMMSRILAIKKGSSNVDRVIRFIGTYVKFVSEKASVQQRKRGPGTSGSDSDDSEETPTSRFISRVLTYLLKGFNAKEKVVRFRSVSILTELLAHLGELDDDMYLNIRKHFMERVQDKESIIRAHSIMGLSKLLGGEDQSEANGEEVSILDVLLDSLCHDPATEVRRVALVHTPLLPHTLPIILTRTRDIDPLVRSCLDLVILSVPIHIVNDTHARSASASRRPATPDSSNCLQAPTQLSLAQRLKVVRDGLGDREDRVRVSAGKMLGSWFDWVCKQRLERTDGRGIKGEELESNSQETIETLVEYLELFGVVGGSGETQEVVTVAADALGSIFLTKRHLLESVVFPARYWKTLTPETALLVRVFVDHITDPSFKRSSDLLESSLFPVLTAFAFNLQELINSILDVLYPGDEPEQPVEEDERSLDEKVFILGEMLKISGKLDFSDEIGRRKVFGIMRIFLAQDRLPESLIEPCIDVLAQAAPDEKEIVRVSVEIINELRDSGGAVSASETDTQSAQNESVGMTQSSSSQSQSKSASQLSKRIKSTEEMSPEEQARNDEIDARCLAICNGMLKHINGTFDQNSTLEGILADLILPAVKRPEMVFRERGLLALGMCCLISKNMAMNSFQLFLNQVQTAPEALKLKVLQVVFDILMVYDEELLHRSKDITEKIVVFLLETLEVEESQAVQALLCIGLSKLMLNGIVTDERALMSLVLAYVSPVTADNQELRQCLSYFLPVYCYSSPNNQSRMQSVFIPTFNNVAQAYEELEEDQEMISPSQFGVLFLDWTNPERVASTKITGLTKRDIHVDLAVDILKALYAKDLAGSFQSRARCVQSATDRMFTSESNRKVLCQLLSKLNFPPKPEKLSLLMINVLLDNFDPVIASQDSPNRKLLGKFTALFKKKYSRVIGGVAVKQYAENSQLREVCELVGVELNFDDSGEESDASEDEEDQLASSPVPGPSKMERVNSRTNRSRESQEEVESSDDEGSSVMPSLRSPPRPASRRPPPVLVDRDKVKSTDARRRTPANGPPSSESDISDDDEDPLPTPLSPRAGGIPTPPGYRTSMKRMRSPNGSDVDSPSPKRSYHGEGLRRPDRGHTTTGDRTRNAELQSYREPRYDPVTPNAVGSDLEYEDYEYEDDEVEPVSASGARSVYYRSPGPGLETPEPE